MRILRANRELYEPLAALDLHLRQCKGDFVEAWNTLDSKGLEFVQGEIARCKQSLRYYLTNYHIIANTVTLELSAVFPLWDSQELILDRVCSARREDRALRLLICKARQQGASSVTEGICFHATILNRNTDTLVLSWCPNHAEYLFSMSKCAFLNLPWWMQPEVQYDAKQYLVFNNKDPHADYFTKGLNSSIRVDSATREFGFAGMGRTPKIIHISELASWPDPKVLTRGLFPAMHGKILAIAESTANGYKNFFYDFWTDCQKGDTEMEWETLFIPDYAVNYHFVELEKGEKLELSQEEKDIQVQAKQTYGIRVPNGYFKWRRASIRETIATEGSDEGFYEQHPVTAEESFQSSGDCPFPKAILRRLLISTCEDPKLVGEIDLGESLHAPVVAMSQWSAQNPQNSRRTGTRFAIWEEPIPGRRYFLAADVAEGVQRDFSCIEVLKMGEGMEPDEQVAEWHGWISLEKFAWVIGAVGYLYNGCDVCPEANDMGRVVIKELYRGLLYPAWYIWKQPDKRKNIYTNFLGWKTQYNNVGTLNQTLAYAVQEGSLVLHSKDLIREMLHFTDESGSGRYSGAEGEDDRVSAMRMAIYCAHDTDTRSGKTRTSHHDSVHGIPGARSSWPMLVDGKIVEGIPNPSNYGPESREAFIRELMIFDQQRGPGAEQIDPESFDSFVTSSGGWSEEDHLR